MVYHESRFISLVWVWVLQDYRTCNENDKNSHVCLLDFEEFMRKIFNRIIHQFTIISVPSF